MSRPRAAVDSGTNSTRLLIVDAEGLPLVRRSTVTRLGAGVDATGVLDERALKRTLAVIDAYRDAWAAAEVSDTEVRIAATSAVRDARNRAAYVTGVYERTGVKPRVLSGDEEARTCFAGVAGALTLDRTTLVVDIGGGSTELIVGEPDGHVRAAHSMQVGSVRVTERQLPADPPSTAQVAAARQAIHDEVDAAIAVLTAAGFDPRRVGALVGVAGTVTTLGRLHGAGEAVHGHVIPAASVADWSARLAAMTVADRMASGLVSEGRADVLAAGAMILDEVCTRLEAGQVTVSTAGLLHGLVASMTDAT